VQFYDSVPSDSNAASSSDTLGQFFRANPATRFIDYRQYHVPGPQQGNDVDYGLHVVVLSFYLALDRPLPRHVDSCIWRAVLAHLVDGTIKNPFSLADNQVIRPTRRLPTSITFRDHCALLAALEEDARNQRVAKIRRDVAALRESCDMITALREAATTTAGEVTRSRTTINS
jgi:hypothetical protein